MRCFFFFFGRLGEGLVIGDFSSFLLALDLNDLGVDVILNLPGLRGSEHIGVGWEDLADASYDIGLDNRFVNFDLSPLEHTEVSGVHILLFVGDLCWVALDDVLELGEHDWVVGEHIEDARG